MFQGVVSSLAPWQCQLGQVKVPLCCGSGDGAKQWSPGCLFGCAACWSLRSVPQDIALSDLPCLDGTGVQVVGGGPTGVEFAGTLSDFVREDLKKKYPE